jgi:hypothetical protein
MKIRILDVERHAKLKDVISEALCIAKEENCIVMFKFNDISVEVSKDDSVEEVRKRYFKKLDEALGLYSEDEEDGE